MKSLKDNLKQAGYALLVVGTLVGFPNVLNYISTKKDIESQPSDKVNLRLLMKKLTLYVILILLGDFSSPVHILQQRKHARNMKEIRVIFLIKFDFCFLR